MLKIRFNLAYAVFLVMSILEANGIFTYAIVPSTLTPTVASNTVATARADNPNWPFISIDEVIIGNLIFTFILYP